MNRYCLALVAIALTLGMCPLRAAPESPNGLDKIAAYAGTWKGQTENLKTPYSKAGKETAEIRNDCWRSGDFYVIHQVVNGKPAMVLSVYTYDAKTNAYHVYAVPTDGSDPGPPGKLVIKGNVWTFPWQDEHAGKTTWFRLVNVFTTPTNIEYRQE